MIECQEDTPRRCYLMDSLALGMCWHAVGPQARLMLEQVESREPVDVEISRAELESLQLKHGDLVSLRLRQGRSFAGDYMI